MTMYSDKVMEHFRNPHNYGKIENADGIGKVGNIVCGDVMYLYIKVDSNKITDIGFETFGCASAIATSSVITDLAKGKTLEEAINIGNNDVVEALDGLPPIKVHCSLLAADALKEAVFDYMKKNKKEIPEQLEKHHQKIQKEMEEIEKKHGIFD